METKFTKGGWVVRDSETVHSLQSTIETKKGVRIAELKSFGNDKQFNDATFEERLFNEKLVCAAPDLLEALEKALSIWGKDYAPKNESESGSILWQLCNNAIKKATE